MHKEILTRSPAGHTADAEAAESLWHGDRMVSDDEHNEMTRAPELMLELEEGARVALVTHAGMPAISDPGVRLISWRSGTIYR